jgi:Holliday junction resolvase RusA-like endonuclease
MKRPVRLKGAPACAYPDTRKPDIDNLAKAVMDGLVESGIIVDDCQVWDCTLRKLVCSLGSPPRAEICIAWRDPVV